MATGAILGAELGPGGCSCCSIPFILGDENIPHTWESPEQPGRFLPLQSWDSSSGSGTHS